MNYKEQKYKKMSMKSYFGRCVECSLWYEERGICTAASDDDLGIYEYTEPDHFCGYFKQKDGEENELRYLI